MADGGQGEGGVPGLNPSDRREFAWLLVREDNLLDLLLKVWRAVPTNQGGWVARGLGHVVNALLLALLVALICALGLGLLLLFTLGPVALFLLVRPLLPAWVWWIPVGFAAFALLVTVVYTMREGADGGETGDPPADVEHTWDPSESLNVSHASSRAFTFSIYFMGFCWLLAAAAILLGDRAFGGPTGEVVPWLLHLGYLTVDTVLLGVLGAVVPPVSEIHAVGWLGHTATVLIRLTVAAGAVSMIGSLALPAFRPRELFNGTVRQLADHLENVDISDGDQLTIHRVAVVRPLDESEVLTISKESFFAALRLR